MVWLMRGAPRRLSTGVVLGVVLAVLGGIMSAPSTSAATVPLPGQVSSVSVTSRAGAPVSVKCPSASNCVMVDQSGHARTYDGTSWSAPQLVDPDADVLLSDNWRAPYLVSLSCPTTDFCMAADADSNLFAYDGTAWASSHVPDTGGAPNDGTRVSCASPTFCMASWGSEWATWDGAEWSTPVGLPQFSSFTEMSCPAAHDCIAIGLSKAYRFDGADWTDFGYVFSNSGDYVNATISCPTSTFCGAIDGRSEAFLVDGTWTSPQDANLYGGGVPNSLISCTDDGTCVVSSVEGSVRIDTPEAQGTFTRVDPHGSMRALDCPTATTCVAADRFGYVTQMSDGAWGVPTMVDPERSNLTTLSCGSADSCLAMDGSGNAFDWDGSAWATPVAIDPQVSWTKVFCTSADFCAATGNRYNGSGSGVLAVRTGGRWTSADTIAPLGVLSCSDSSFCLAAGSGLAQVWDGTTWSAATRPVYGARGMSCPIAGWCFTGDAIYHDGAWSAAPTPPARVSAAGRDAVWCTSTSNCLVENSSGSVARFDGTSWTATTGLGGSGGRLQCASAALCISSTVPSVGSLAADYLVPAPSPAGARRSVVSSNCPTIDVCVVMDQASVTVWRTGFQPPRIVQQPANATEPPGATCPPKAPRRPSPTPSLSAIARSSPTRSVRRRPPSLSSRVRKRPVAEPVRATGTPQDPSRPDRWRP